MKQAKYHLGFFGKVYLMIGAPLFTAGIIFVILYRIWDSFTFIILAAVFGFQGVMWLIIGGCFYMHAKKKALTHEQLKRSGKRYDAEIVRIVPRPYIRVNYNTTVYIECIYVNNEGKKCLVKSDAVYPYNPGEELIATVYVSRGDPKDYYVEVMTKAETEINQIDYDYR